MCDLVRKNGLDEEIVAFVTDSICIAIQLDIDSCKLCYFSFEVESDDTFYLQTGFTCL